MPSPSISSAALAALLTREDDDPLILLLTITHPQIDTIWLARNVVGKNITSRGTTFTAAPIAVQLATDTDDQPTMRITIPNVDRAIGLALLASSGPLTVAVEAVLASNPDDVIRRYARFELVDLQFDALAVSGELRQARLTSEPYPNVRVTPNKFPAFFR
jgi:hypothetical protein